MDVRLCKQLRAIERPATINIEHACSSRATQVASYKPRVYTMFESSAKLLPARESSKRLDASQRHSAIAERAASPGFPFGPKSFTLLAVRPPEKV